MATYRIKWEIEVNADSPEQAASEALNIQKDPNSEALFFEVTHLATGEETQIDVMELKSNIIKKIQDIISEYEDFGIGDVMSDFSPQLGWAGDAVELLEHFHYDSAVAVTYDDGGNVEISIRDVDYNYIPLEVLNEILQLAEQWAEICGK